MLLFFNFSSSSLFNKNEQQNIVFFIVKIVTRLTGKVHDSEHYFHIANAKHSITTYILIAEQISPRLQTDKPEGDDIIYVVNCMKCCLPLKYLTVNCFLRKWHLSCYSYYKSSEKSWMRKGADCDYDKRNTFLVTCDIDTP